MQSETAPTTTPATFTHTIRPAVTRNTGLNYRAYGAESPYSPGYVNSIMESVRDMTASAYVRREAESDMAELRLVSRFMPTDGCPLEGPSESLTIMRMSTRSLRELACALLDAAHDIETNPARTLLANGTSKAAA